MQVSITSSSFYYRSVDYFFTTRSLCLQMEKRSAMSFQPLFIACVDAKLFASRMFIHFGLLWMHVNNERKRDREGVFWRSVCVTKNCLCLCVMREPSSSPWVVIRRECKKRRRRCTINCIWDDFSTPATIQKLPCVNIFYTCLSLSVKLFWTIKTNCWEALPFPSNLVYTELIQKTTKNKLNTSF